MHAAPAIAPPAAAARALGKLSAPGEEVVEQRRARSSAETDQAGPQAKRSIASNDPRRLESAVDDRVSPEALLERIAKLRDEGRHAEARESLAAFKKRYPDHPLPDALRSY
jgi:hypothetical protein